MGSEASALIRRKGEDIADLGDQIAGRGIHETDYACQWQRGMCSVKNGKESDTWIWLCTFRDDLSDEIITRSERTDGYVIIEGRVVYRALEVCGGV